MQAHPINNQCTYFLMQHPKNLIANHTKGKKKKKTEEGKRGRYALLEGQTAACPRCKEY